MPVVLKTKHIKRLDPEKLYSRLGVTKGLGVSPKTFYRYYVELYKIEADELVDTRTRLYRGKTVNDISEQLAADPCLKFELKD